MAVVDGRAVARSPAAIGADKKRSGVPPLRRTARLTESISNRGPFFPMIRRARHGPLRTRTARRYAPAAWGSRARDGPPVSAGDDRRAPPPVAGAPLSGGPAPLPSPYSPDELSCGFTGLGSV